MGCDVTHENVKCKNSKVHDWLPASAALSPGSSVQSGSSSHAVIGLSPGGGNVAPRAKPPAAVT